MKRDDSEFDQRLGDVIYKEVVPFNLMTVVTVVMAALTVFFLYQFIVRPVGGNTELSWYFGGMFLVFALISVFIFSMRRLTVSMTTRRITVAFGVIKYQISWDNIERYGLDKSLGIRYGGWGIRISRLNDRWTLVYSVTNCPRVVLQLRGGRFRQFVFSTRHPEEIMNIAMERVKQNSVSTENWCP